jgi:hypothetical protein
MRRLLIGLLVVVLIGAYALVAPKIGLAWPYPLVLPDQTHFHGAWYDRSDDCLVKPPGGGEWEPAGEMWTALGPIGRPRIYAPAIRTLGTPLTTEPESLYLIAVRDGGCYRVYRLDHAPAP